MTKEGILPFLTSFVLVFSVAGFNRLFKPGEWYQSLVKPSWTPPPWAFGVIWTLLYIFMAISLYLLYRTEPSTLKNWALSLFLFQLALNAVWSAIFFGLKQTIWGLVDITLLWLAVFALIATSWPVHRGATALLIPYQIWLSIAWCLNLQIVKLNEFGK